ncbi:LytR family transcriptional regulator [Nocardioides guangzhouensis]|uniref:LytR family transcriptional regulator n=2 Tax=Nocardioides guangzhouensis TaxID=2497878 RepID=A0A4Q4Z7Z9_9ACTN|nr:LytR family transcriptional regulator [Nocardioides guangzhouensis]
MLSIVAVAAAGFAFVATNGSGEEGTLQTVSRPQPTPTETAPAPVVRKPKPKPKPPAVDRGKVYVEVYNNSGIKGLAGTTAGRATGAGWQVVGSDNWYGTIPSSTVYYPAKLERAAKLLGKDLGVARLKPAIDPMRLDRLTVILTADYAG